METVTIIAKLKEGYTIEQAAYEVWETFGKGGNPDPDINIEEHLGWVNTPVSNGYVRCRVDTYYADTLEYLESIGGADTIDLVAVERDGQQEFDVGNGELLGMIC